MNVEQRHLHHLERLNLPSTHLNIFLASTNKLPPGSNCTAKQEMGTCPTRFKKYWQNLQKPPCPLHQKRHGRILEVLTGNVHYKEDRKLAVQRSRLDTHRPGARLSCVEF